MSYTEILQPFQLDGNGFIVTTTDPNVQASQHIESLIATSQTERCMIPDYGTSVKDSVFTPDDDIVGPMLQEEITNQMATYESNIVVDSVEAVSSGDPEDPAQVNLSWHLNSVQTGSSTGVQTATILIGGTVVINS